MLWFGERNTTVMILLTNPVDNLYINFGYFFFGFLRKLKRQVFEQL